MTPIRADDLARVAGVSRGTIKELSMAGVLPPILGYDNAHIALYDLDDERLAKWMEEVKQAASDGK